MDGAATNAPGRAGRALAAPRRLASRASDLLERVPFSLHLLLLRLAIAGVFLPAGLLKVTSWESTLALFQDEYKVPILAPAVAAVMATGIELGSSSLLIAGLATRLATLPLLGQIATIQLFVYPQAWREHLVWGSILLVLLTRGGGALSIDRALAGRRRGTPAG
jgi:putative oxidoreductase